MSSISQAAAKDLNAGAIASGMCVVELESGTLLEKLFRRAPKEFAGRLVFTTQHGSKALPLAPASAAFACIQLLGSQIIAGGVKGNSHRLGSRLLALLPKEEESYRTIRDWRLYDTINSIIPHAMQMQYFPQHHRLEDAGLHLEVGTQSAVLPIDPNHVLLWQDLFRTLKHPTWELDLGKAPAPAAVDF